MVDPLIALEEAAEERIAGLSRAERASRGIVHTPAPLARWIARACPALDETTTVLDPACGPGVFLAAALAEMHGVPGRCIGSDVDEGAITLARRELEPLFARAGWPLELVVRDALADVPSVAGSAIVIGNPPWTARAASRGISDALLADFRVDADGADLGERKIGVLSDSYVRFVRWATAVVERAPGGGTLALVVSSSFLDGHVHRGMRSYLTRAFDRIDLVDLGGSSLVARSGVRDENVFGVRPGAVIVIATRAPGRSARSAGVRVARLHGSKAEKLARLGSDLSRSLQPVRLVPPALRFAVTTSDALPTSWPTLDAWMPWSREGVQTNRDALCIDHDREALLARVRAFVARPDRALIRGHFDPERAAERLRMESAPLERFVQRIAYRPLDERWLFAHPALCHRARPEIARALAHAPIALVTASKDRGEQPFAHLGFVRTIVDNCWLSSRSSCRARAFPAFTPDGLPNVGGEVRDRLPLEVPPEDVMAYLAAWLGAASFRSRFDESLRAGPIRVPLPASPEIWAACVVAGRAIVEAFVGDAEGAPRQLVIGQRHLPPSARAASIGAAQDAADAVVRDLIGSAS